MSLRLGSAKEVAQIGAVIGRVFSYALLAAVARKEEGALRAALDALTEAGLLFRQGAPPHATYLFKHGLVQDTASSTLLRERRRALHARIAEVLETQFPEITESQPELLARHCTEAGLIEKSAAFWAKAGRRSLAASRRVLVVHHEGVAPGFLQAGEEFGIVRQGRNDTGQHRDGLARPSIWSFVRIDQTYLGRSGGFDPVSLPLFQGDRLWGTGVAFTCSCMVITATSAATEALRIVNRSSYAPEHAPPRYEVRCRFRSVR